MEEGPEPHEFIKESVEHHHQEQEHEHAPEHVRREVVVSACTAAVLAVCAALGSLLSGHAANEAILDQTRATDQWSYYQAKSTKGHIYEVGKEIVNALGTGEKSHTAQERFVQQVKKYNQEKDEIMHEAQHLEDEAKRELAKHHAFSLGVAAFQVGIVLASISIMVRYRTIWLLSLVGGAAGIVLLVTGWVQ